MICDHDIKYSDQIMHFNHHDCMFFVFILIITITEKLSTGLLTISSSSGHLDTVTGIHTALSDPSLEWGGSSINNS